ncbi:MAG: ATP-binding protein [Bacteroidota bacterium]
MRDSRVDRETFRQLSQRYQLALSGILILLLISQYLIQSHLNKQINDSRVVNVAGRQRMLSQRLSKELLQYHLQPATSKASAIRETLDLWTRSHIGLQYGNAEMGLPGKNSDEIEEMFTAMEPDYQAMLAGVQQALSLTEMDSQRMGVEQVLAHEAAFLKQMNQIVFAYDSEAREKVASLKRTEYILLGISIFLLLIEALFIFRPMTFQISRMVRSIRGSERDAKEMATKIEALYQEKRHSLQELQALNYAIDKAAYFVGITQTGRVVYLSEKMRQILRVQEIGPDDSFVKLVSGKEREQQFLEEAMRKARNRVWQQDVELTLSHGQKVWFDMSMIPVRSPQADQDLFVLCHEITSLKEAQDELATVTQQKFEAEMSAQKLRSRQIIRAQEEERRRIARDIHDSIGQMLTALRFQIGAIKLQDTTQARKKLQTIEDISGQLIKGVRIATFNLNPPELSDYGLPSALAKMAEELSKLTGQTILFSNKTDFEARMDPVVETNLFRVAQEAINNAIKYAQSPFVLVTISHSDQLLSIVVDDNGKGFDVEKVEAMVEAGQKTNGSGLGLSFMRERVGYVQGRLFINSVPGEGTRVTINVPLGEG